MAGKKGSIAVQADIKSVKMNVGSYGPAKIAVTIEFETPKPRAFEDVVISPMQQILQGFGGLLLEAPSDNFDADDDGGDDGDDE